MKTVLSYAKYRERLSNIATPEDAAAFAQDLIAPMLAGMKPSPEPEEETLEEAEPARPAALKLSKKRGPNPWRDVIGNETDALVIDLYAKGLTTSDIASHLRSQHGIDMAQSAISGITDKVMPLVREWQSRPLSSCYPILYLDGIHFKVRDSGKVLSKCAYIALGITPFGQKEVLGIWVSETEGAKFWLGVLNDLKNRGVEDVLVACVDGLKGFPEAIKTMYPQAEVQVCIVHQIRHTVMFIPHKDKEKFCQDLKAVYTAPSEQAGKDALRSLTERWPQYRSYLKGWEDRWQDLAPFFGYPEPVRRAVYTTNVIENLNRQFRKVTKTTGVFPHDDALVKLLWLAQADLAQSWTMPLRNWGETMAQLSILFPDRIQF